MDEKKPSRIIPNAYQSPNFYVDDLLNLLTGEEWKCMSFLIRKTLGWQKTKDRLAKSVIANATGLSESTVEKCMANLKAFGLALRLSENNAANDGIEWGVQMDDEQINWSALEERRQQIIAKNVERTEAARKAAAYKRALGWDEMGGDVAHGGDVGQTAGGDVTQTAGGDVGQGTQKTIKANEKEREIASTDSAFPEIVNALEALVGGLKGDDARLIGIWLEKHTVERIKQAIEVARGNGARSAKYVDEVLISWEAHGYPKSREERVAERKSQVKQSPNATPPADDNFEQELAAKRARLKSEPVKFIGANA